MADLDSFFAKKDKKKVKGKKFTTQDEIAKRLDETEKKDKKSDVIDEPTKVEEKKTKEKEEEEWHDFSEEAESDLTDLKISKLNITEDEELRGSGVYIDENGEKYIGEEKREGVWKTVEAQGQVKQEIPSVITPEEPEPFVPAAVTSYVAPGLRTASSPLIPKHLGRKKVVAPDISSEEAFPSLSGTPPPTNPVVKKKNADDSTRLENVKHGYSRSIPDDDISPKLSVQNRFDALSERS